MPTDRDQLLRSKPELASLRPGRALGRLRSTLTAMNTGAHPDDEQSGLLAWLRFGLGMRVVIACSTRGEGGQNALGPERGAALGLLRSREMELAARELDADLVWLGHGPDDPVHDFGFSKDGDDTLARWGKDRIVERLVRAYRTERPDIVIPTFLDVPGQHGHHRAMTRAAWEAVALAADPTAFPEHFEAGLLPWYVAKFYLPAWSGAGGTYDDEVPPPKATLLVEADDLDPVSGAPFDQIGEWSRAFHASQGMGRWKAEWTTRWPLHLVDAGEEKSVTEGLPATLSHLATADADQAAGEMLASAQAHVDVAVASFADGGKVVEPLVSAARDIEQATSRGSQNFLQLHGHRLARKLDEIGAALFAASGISVRAALEPTVLRAGEPADLFVRVETQDAGAVDSLSVVPALPAGMSATPPQIHLADWRFRVDVLRDAAMTPAFLPGWASLGGNGPVHLAVDALIGGRAVRQKIDLDEPAAIVPAHAVRLEPDRFIVKRDDENRHWRFDVDGGRKVTFDAPEGWSVGRRQGQSELVAPQQLSTGTFSIVPIIGRVPATRRIEIAYPHIGRTTLHVEERLDVLVLDLALPDCRVGYVGGGADNVGVWLKRMGFDVIDLQSADLGADLSYFTTIVVGIFAFGSRPDLAAATARLRRFVEQGGHLVTLYHRPSDGWDADTTPPRRLEIGSPSLRWRVANPAVPVDVLLPDHSLLNRPNVIGSQDWSGWDKERGLYFASAWDAAYEPLLSMHDDGEQALTGALMSASIDEGRHTHVSLALHHQLDRLVPGAFRLMANLVQRA